NTMQLIRRHFLRLACAAAAASAVSRTAGAQTYPTRSVRIIVPFAAGGPATVLAHLLAQPLTETWGQSFYVENLPTAASTPATRRKGPSGRLCVAHRASELRHKPEPLCQAGV